MNTELGVGSEINMDINKNDFKLKLIYESYSRIWKTFLVENCHSHPFLCPKLQLVTNLPRQTPRKSQCIQYIAISQSYNLMHLTPSMA